VESFLDPDNRIGVVGVSKDTSKWGYRLFTHLRDQGLDVYPINPKYEEIDGAECFADVASVTTGLDVVVTVVPPDITEEIVEQCLEAGIRRVWMQPGSESEDAIEFCKLNGMEVVHDACMVTDGLQQEFSV
jgi:predicted CoA-binding protein